jgi:hypothetical protein
VRGSEGVTPGRDVEPLDADHRIIVADQYQYSSHPHAVKLDSGELVMVFNQSVRRAIVHHPPSDPLFRNYVTRSHDLGDSWELPQVAPSYDLSGVECAGLTALAGGTVLLHQYRFKWYSLAEGEKRSRTEEVLAPRDFLGYQGSASIGQASWSRGNGSAYVQRSEDGGRTWQVGEALDTGSFSGGYGIRGGVRLDDGSLLLPLCDVPAYETVFFLRSSDDGHTWARPVSSLHITGSRFEEPAALSAGGGRIVVLCRESTTDHLYQARSTDNGLTWTVPWDTGIVGCPPHLLQLSDGRFMCTYGYRYDPFQIRAAFSDDLGETWAGRMVIRSGLGCMDMGYPSSVELEAGRVLTVYYGRLLDGTASILATTFSIGG